MADLNIYNGFPKSISILRPTGIERVLLYHPVNQPNPDLSYGHTFVSDNCNGIYLKWLSKKSDYQYMMTYPQFTESLQIKDLGRILNTDTNRARALSATHSIGKSAKVRFKVSARVDKLDKNVQQSILYSPEVYMWQNDAILSGVSCSEFIKVFIQPGTFTVSKGDANGVKLSFTIELDQKNVQTII